MKRSLIIVALAVTGCAAQSPTAPSERTVTVTIPASHNVPATAPDGTVWYVCATQPRTYLREVRPGFEWVRSTERDHYLQRTECPRTPID